MKNILPITSDPVVKNGGMQPARISIGNMRFPTIAPIRPHMSPSERDMVLKNHLKWFWCWLYFYLRVVGNKSMTIDKITFIATPPEA